MSVTWQDLTLAPNLFDASAELQFPLARRPHRLGGRKHLHIHEAAGLVEVHPLLGECTPIWGYQGEYPGPTVEVRSGDRVFVSYFNQIEGDLPYAHVVADTSATPPGSMNDPGEAQASTDPLDIQEAQAVGALNAWTVVHLHGAPTLPDSDGWTESVLGSGEDVVMGYEFPSETFTMAHPPKRPGGDPVVEDYPGGAAPLYWYHDHAMGVTRFNVFAGLAAAWLVRHPIEEEIGLPQGRYELPLVLQDRNFATSGGPADPLTGAFLHKVDTDTRECFAPANLVNGKLWPRARVRPRVYRLRLVNGANARTYRLHFMGLTSTDEATRAPLTGDHVQQIGTDGGLLGQAVDLPDGSLTLAPAERADMLIDFGRIALDGYTHVVVYNSAAAPFQGAALGDHPEAVYTGNRDEFREFPQVMRFDLIDGTPHPCLGSATIRRMSLDPGFKRLPIDHSQYPSDHGHTLVVLREEDVPSATTSPSPSPMLFLHEMMAEAEADQRGTNLTKVMDPTTGTPQGIRLKLSDDPTTYVTVAKRFHDTTSIIIPKDSWRLWKVLNLSPDTHPFHIHLVQFQAIARKWYPADDPQTPILKGETNVTFTRPPIPQMLDANETGWKDTIRVNPGKRTEDGADSIVAAEMVIVAAQFRRHAGRYMYHCHILEHEDMEMMRPYVVTPRETMPFMKNMPGLTEMPTTNPVDDGPMPM